MKYMYFYIQGSRVVTRQSSRPLTTNDNEATATAAVASGPVAAGASPDSGSGGGLNGGEWHGKGEATAPIC